MTDMNGLEKDEGCHESSQPANLAQPEIQINTVPTSGVPRKFFSGGGSTNSVEDRGQRKGSGGGSPLVRGSGGSCNLVQEISFHIVKFS